MSLALSVLAVNNNTKSLSSLQQEGNKGMVFSMYKCGFSGQVTHACCWLGFPTHHRAGRVPLESLGREDVHVAQVVRDVERDPPPPKLGGPQATRSHGVGRSTLHLLDVGGFSSSLMEKLQPPEQPLSFLEKQCRESTSFSFLGR